MSEKEKHKDLNSTGLKGINQLVRVSREEKKECYFNRFKKQMQEVLFVLLNRDSERGDYLLKIFRDIININNIEAKSAEFEFTEKRIVSALSSLFRVQRGLADNEATKSARFLEYYASSYRTQFKEIVQIGSGSYGTVYKARHTLDQMDYAIKKIPIKCSSTKAIELSLKEVKILAKLHHINIVVYKQAWIEPISYENDSDSQSSSNETETSSSKGTDSGEIQLENIPPEGKIKSPKIMLYIQMNLCTKNLRKWLDERNGFFPRRTIDSIGTQILSGLSYIHKMKVVHHDINPNNIFISEKSNEIHIQLGDFGLACSSKKKNHSNSIGTAMYEAPEQAHKACDYKSDIYSFGIVLLELLYFVKTMSELRDLIVNLKKDSLPEILQENYPLWTQVLRKSTHKNPAQRPSACSLLKNLKIESHPELNMLHSMMNLLMDNNQKLHLEVAASNSIINALQARNKKKNRIIAGLLRKLSIIETQVRA